MTLIVVVGLHWKIPMHRVSLAISSDARACRKNATPPWMPSTRTLTRETRNSGTAYKQLYSPPVHLFQPLPMQCNAMQSYAPCRNSLSSRSLSLILIPLFNYLQGGEGETETKLSGNGTVGQRKCPALFR